MIYSVPSMIVFPEDKQGLRYLPEEIFRLPWVKTKKYVEYALPKVYLTYRILRNTDSTSKKSSLKILVKHKKEKPWLLGNVQNLEEAKYRIYSHIITFRLYVTGKWEVAGKPTTLYERYKRALYHFYPSDFLDQIPFDTYHLKS